jgi:hypothetical protein
MAVCERNPDATFIRFASLVALVGPLVSSREHSIGVAFVIGDGQISLERFN